MEIDNFFNGKNILVTGGAGFVGSHLVEELVKLEANVFIVDTNTDDKQSYLFIENLQKKSKVINLDICDYKKLLNLIKSEKIEFIFHLAAQALVEEAYDNPKKTLENNIVSTIDILEAVRTNPQIKGLIVASSDKAYGKLNKEKYIETDSLSGDHPYDTSKSVTDLISTTYYKTYGIPVAVTRFGNIYGEGDSNFSRIIPGIMKSIITGKTLELRSDGKYIRDYLYVKDVAKGYLMLAKKIDEIKGETFNFGSDDTFSVIALIEEVEKILNIKIPYKILNTAKNEIPYQSLDCTKIEKVINWRQAFLLKNTIPNIYSWYKKII